VATPEIKLEVPVTALSDRRGTNPSRAASNPPPARHRVGKAVGRYSLTQTQENIAVAIAEGIAWGRKEGRKAGIAMAAEAVARLKDENDA
jgi:hypothetical protein